MICGFPLAFRIWTFLERVVDGLVSHVAPRGWCKVQMAVHHLHQGGPVIIALSGVEALLA